MIEHALAVWATTGTSSAFKPPGTPSDRCARAAPCHRRDPSASFAAAKGSARFFEFAPKGVELRQRRTADEISEIEAADTPMIGVVFGPGRFTRRGTIPASPSTR